MCEEIDKIIKNSNKAEYLEIIEKELATADKVITILITDKEDGSYTSQVLTLCIPTSYEAYGILDVAKIDIQDDCDS